jgi:hypothetical protein
MRVIFIYIHHVTYSIHIKHTYMAVYEWDFHDSGLILFCSFVWFSILLFPERFTNVNGMLNTPIFYFVRNNWYIRIKFHLALNFIPFQISLSKFSQDVLVLFCPVNSIFLFFLFIFFFNFILFIRDWTS